ncbi:hypothetical protein K5549_019836, partial [Capra hircus]
MSARAALLLLWGLALSPVTEQATFFDPRPSLWAEASSPLAPWANVTLTCQSPLPALEFQLLKDGVGQEPVHLESPAHEHRFPLGPVTSTTRGLYSCRYKGNDDWISPSNPVDVTGAEPLPPPSLSTSPVSWITPGLNTTLLCLSGLRGVTFLLRQEGEDQFVEVAEAPEATQASFPVHRAGNYSCSYRTHAAGTPSEPSATVTVEELAAPPPAPRLTVDRESAQVLRPGSPASLTCVAPLSDVDFQLRRGAEEQLVPRASTSPDRVFFLLSALAAGDGGGSRDSAPAELVLSDGEPTGRDRGAARAGTEPGRGPARARGARSLASRGRGAQGQLRRALRPLLGGWRFPPGRCVPVMGTPGGLRPHGRSRGWGGEARQLQRSAQGRRGRAARPGPLPRPQLRALWTGALTPGRDAVLRCEAQVPDVSFLLLRAGEEEPLVVAWSTNRSADLVLTHVGRQHAGTYSCRYRTGGSRSLLSELSDPVELQVAGE